MTIETELADGTPILIRRVRPEDKRLLVSGMSRLSERSRRQRFLTPTEQLSRSQLSYLTEIDQHDHQAWGALVGEEPVGIGRFVRTEGDAAEVALTVVDDWHRRGVGSLLLGVLIDEARKIGIKRLLFVALPENAAIAGLLARYGVTGEIEAGLAQYTLDLARDP